MIVSFMISIRIIYILLLFVSSYSFGQLDKPNSFESRCKDLDGDYQSGQCKSLTLKLLSMPVFSSRELLQKTLFQLIH